MGIAATSVFLALLILSLIICAVNWIFWPVYTPYFSKGSPQEDYLIKEFKAYLSEFCPSLLCNCDGEIAIHEEIQLKPKTRYRVMFDIRCHDTCNLNHVREGFIVEALGPFEITIIEPINDEFAQKYC